ncbi:Galactokinase [Candidatus Desulfarcum epimagneticum]|uniref:Galactokinase n=1 Tax=uncultured Desulfobacteraceae bacterium TaxID=218296 RepID=A0A484HNZ4_9BACT|nr:Galactokinase [uncultured Desulfobacteraceae bacterium]
MTDIFTRTLESGPVENSAPCRVDMGGTLDIPAFYLSIRKPAPLTFNIALDLRTRVRLLPHDPGRVKVSSRGFESADFPLDEAPFSHPLGLMFAIAVYFNGMDSQSPGVHMEIDSASPPRSALGGSSAAAVAAVGAFLQARAPGSQKQGDMFRTGAALTAHAIEQGAAGVPCGRQDHLAAAFGGVSAWLWKKGPGEVCFERKSLLKKEDIPDFEKKILIAYCGRPHVSQDINGRWIAAFLAGENRTVWKKIAHCARTFTDAVEKGDIRAAASAMSRETALRLEMTPDALDDMGRAFVRAAADAGCGAKFTGAGGGGCVWAMGEGPDIARLKEKWKPLAAAGPGSRVLDAGIDSLGLA